MVIKFLELDTAKDGTIKTGQPQAVECQISMPKVMQPQRLHNLGGVAIDLGVEGDASTE